MHFFFTLHEKKCTNPIFSLNLIYSYVSIYLSIKMITNNKENDYATEYN